MNVLLGQQTVRQTPAVKILLDPTPVSVTKDIKEQDMFVKVCHIRLLSVDSSI